MKPDEVEIWKPIPDWPMYQVSTLGRVKGQRGQLIEAPCDHKGYPRVDFRNKGRRAQIRVHRLVLLAFIGRPPDGHEAMHLNNNRSDNRVENLRWGTSRENWEQKVFEGRAAMKLTPGAVREIRARVSEKQTVLAREYGVHQSEISRIRSRQIWGWLSQEGGSVA
jgi:hypothetical protein